MINFISMLITGWMIGSVYSLVALGFIVIYRSSRVFNFAQGSLVMFGGYVVWDLSVRIGLPIWSSIALGMFVAAVIGMLIYSLVIRPLIGQSVLAIITMTIGLSIILDNIVITFWGGGEKTYPAIFPRESLSLGPVNVSYEYILGLFIVWLLLGFFALFFRYTKFGLAIRATSEFPQLAQSLGISVKTVFCCIWIIAAVVAGMGGFLLGNLVGIGLHLSITGLKAFPVVLLGGVESFVGCLVAGPIVGILEVMGATYLDPYVGGGVADVIPYIVLTLILIIKPYGFFGEVRIERI